MNTEQAIKDLMFLLHTDLNVYSKNEVYSLEPSINLAIAALRAQQEQQNPKPLTLEELKERDGKPVWFQPTNGDNGWWRVVNLVEAFDGDVFNFTDSWAWQKAYGKTWLAYDHEPKEAQK